MQRSIEDVLKSWKEKSEHLPLILRGARQVGKSYIIEKFANDHFDSSIICNFDLEPALKSCFSDLNPSVICAKLETAFNKKIVPGKTLLFLDEIQNCPQAIASLRYFKEKLPSLHVIGAGSLLEFVLHEGKFSFPVGRVQFLHLRPLSFREYLLAQEHEALLELLENAPYKQPFDTFFHNRLLSLVREYFLIGGMPAVVRCFLKEKSFLACQQLLKGLLETYRTDFPKYSTKTQHTHLQLFFEKSPKLVCTQFKYTHISPEERSSDLKVALEQLQWSGLLQKIVVTNASGIPLEIHAKETKFKLLFLDMGLVNSANNLDIQTTWDLDLLSINSGALAEQFVGQELLAYSDPYTRGKLYYWDRDKKGSQAEVDYVLQKGSHIIPIEVKRGTTGSLKSLYQFLKEKNSPFGIRISEHPLSFHNQVLSIPLYLIGELHRLIDAVLIDTTPYKGKKTTSKEL